MENMKKEKNTVENTVVTGWRLCNHCERAFHGDTTINRHETPTGGGECPYCGASAWMDGFKWSSARSVGYPRTPKQGHTYPLYPTEADLERIKKEG